MELSGKASPNEVFLKEHLLYVITKAEAGEYNDAMAALQETLVTANDNVYVRAVEKQLLSLLDLSRRNALTDERKAEILDPISAIVERAINTPPQIQNRAEDASLKGQPHPEDALNVQEKRAALDSLKVSYFERASQHLKRGDYNLALAEIRRVFVIEPGNATANQYESIILELLKLKAPASLPLQPTISARSTVPDAIAKRAPVIRGTQPAVRVFPDPVQSPPTPVRIPEPIPAIVSEPEPSTSYGTEPPASIEPVSPDFVFSADAPPEKLQRRSARSKRYRAMVAFSVFFLCAGTVSLVILQGKSDAPFGESPAGTISAIPLSPDRTADNISIVPVSIVQKGQNSDAPLSPVPGRSPQSTSKAGSSLGLDQIVNSITLAPAKQSRPAIHDVDAAPVSDDLPAQANPTQSTDRDKSQILAAETSTVAVNVPEPDEFVAYERQPQVVQLVRPEIPDNAWAGATAIQVVVRVMIDADGKPVKMKFLTSDSQPIQNAVTAAMMKSTFTPGIMGKSPVITWLTVPLKVRREN